MSNFDREMTICRDVLVQNGVSETTARHMAYRLAVGLLEDREKAKRHRIESFELNYGGWIPLGAHCVPPRPPEGYGVEAIRDHMGVWTHYRMHEMPAKPNPDSPWAKNWDVV